MGMVEAVSARDNEIQQQKSQLEKPVVIEVGSGPEEHRTRRNDNDKLSSGMNARTRPCSPNSRVGEEAAGIRRSPRKIDCMKIINENHGEADSSESCFHVRYTGIPAVHA
mgnify:CR=1 FL=1